MSFFARTSTPAATAGNFNLPIPFPYLSKDHVYFFTKAPGADPVAVARSAVSWPSEGVATVALSAGSAGRVLIARRITPGRDAMVRYSGAGTISSSALNTSVTQLLYLIQEESDSDFEARLGGNIEDAVLGGDASGQVVPVARLSSLAGKLVAGASDGKSLVPASGVTGLPATSVGAALINQPTKALLRDYMDVYARGRSPMLTPAHFPNLFAKMASAVDGATPVVIKVGVLGPSTYATPQAEMTAADLPAAILKRYLDLYFNKLGRFDFQVTNLAVDGTSVNTATRNYEVVQDGPGSVPAGAPVPWPHAQSIRAYGFTLVVNGYGTNDGSRGSFNTGQTASVNGYSALTRQLIEYARDDGTDYLQITHGHKHSKYDWVYYPPTSYVYPGPFTATPDTNPATSTIFPPLTQTVGGRLGDGTIKPLMRDDWLDTGNDANSFIIGYADRRIAEMSREVCAQQNVPLIDAERYDLVQRLVLGEDALFPKNTAGQITDPLHWNRTGLVGHIEPAISDALYQLSQAFHGGNPANHPQGSLGINTAPVKGTGLTLAPTRTGSPSARFLNKAGASVLRVGEAEVRSGTGIPFEGQLFRQVYGNHAAGNLAAPEWKSLAVYNLSAALTLPFAGAGLYEVLISAINAGVGTKTLRLLVFMSPGSQGLPPAYTIEDFGGKARSVGGNVQNSALDGAGGEANTLFSVSVGAGGLTLTPGANNTNFTVAYIS